MNTRGRLIADQIKHKMNYLLRQTEFPESTSYFVSVASLVRGEGKFNVSTILLLLNKKQVFDRKRTW